MTYSSWLQLWQHLFFSYVISKPKDGDPVNCPQTEEQVAEWAKQQAILRGCWLQCSPACWLIKCDGRDSRLMRILGWRQMIDRKLKCSFSQFSFEEISLNALWNLLTPIATNRLTILVANCSIPNFLIYPIQATDLFFSHLLKKIKIFEATSTWITFFQSLQNHHKWKAKSFSA